MSTALTSNKIGVSVIDMKSMKRSYAMTTRTAAAQATRRRIRDAAVALYFERPIDDFTLEHIATRAETTVRTVLRSFGSKDNLLTVALDEIAASGKSLKPTPPGDIAAAVSAIFDIYETFGDLVIQRLADETRRPALKPGLDDGRRNHRDWVRTIFAPQLARYAGATRTLLQTILVVATDVYVWKKLRRDSGMSRPAAEKIMRAMVASAVAVEQEDGTHSVVELVGRR
jgi:AcrR family transcriptional regulator